MRLKAKTRGENQVHKNAIIIIIFTLVIIILNLHWNISCENKSSSNDMKYSMLISGMLTLKRKFKKLITCTMQSNNMT